MSDPIYLFKAKDTRKRGIKFELIKLSSSSWSLFIGIKTKVLQKKRKVHFSLKLSKNQWIKPMKCNAPSFFLISFLFIFFFFCISNWEMPHEMLYVESFTRIDDFNASLWHAQLQMFIFVLRDRSCVNRFAYNRCVHFECGCSCMNKIATTMLFARIAIPKLSLMYDLVVSWYLLIIEKRMINKEF